MQPRSSLGQGTVLRVQVLAMMATCVLAGFAAPAGESTVSGKPLLAEGGSDVPAISLVDRCQKMLDLQLAVFDSTKRLHQVTQETANKKPRPDDRRAALRLADEEKAIVVAAAQALDALEKQGAARAFLEAIRELSKDMERVEGRLKSGDVSADTQAVEQEIIDTLKELISALRKH